MWVDREMVGEKGVVALRREGVGSQLGTDGGALGASTGKGEPVARQRVIA